MSNSRFSIQTLRYGATLLGRLVLCLSLLITLSLVAMEELRWSAADQTLDNYNLVKTELVAKTRGCSQLPETGKEQIDLSWWQHAALEHHSSIHPPTDLTSWHRHSPPIHDLISRQAPFPPRAPTA